MPKIYLSPSTQEANPYINGGTEEEIMNQLADAMIPYLNANGISYIRNTPQMTAASSIRQSNEGDYDLHLALHSNAAPESNSGQVRGSDIYYYPSSVKGKQEANLLADAFKTIYPDPNKVRALPTTSLGEVSKTKAPGILIETAYHDNPEDAQWIKDNIDNMARVIVESLTKYFGMPFITPVAPYPGIVNIRWGHLNLRDKPSTNSKIIGTLFNGQRITILGRYGDWYSVETPSGFGFVSSDYVQSY
ncbi:MAG: SH3 domain-containing protein [Oscillospiraceae bacterium]|nr:SH3 domain-containing protein [Oscillospiraceae bacterium]